MVQCDCEEFRKNIHPLLDGELEGDKLEAMLAHMEGCTGCREEYEQLLDVRDMLAHMDDDLETPIEFERGWREAVRRESSVRKQKRWVKALSCVAAGMIFLAGATVVNRFTGSIPGADANPAPTQTVSTMDMDSGVMPASAQDEVLADGADAAGTGALPTEYAPDPGVTPLMRGMPEDDSAEGVAAKYDYSDKDGLGETSSGGLLDVNDSDNSQGSSRKVLRSASLSIETESFDEDMSQIKSTVAKFGGLFERNAISGAQGARSAQLTLRVPAGFLETFVEQLRGIGTVTHSEVSAQDITSQYTDTALRLDTLRTQLTRVKELTTTAADLNEVLALEAEASRLQYEIDKLTGVLRGFDSQTELSTVTVLLSEYSRMEATAAGLGGFAGDMGASFSAAMGKVGGFISDMLITAAALLPHLIWAAPLAVLIWFGIRLFKRKGHGGSRHAA